MESAPKWGAFSLGLIGCRNRLRRLFIIQRNTFEIIFIAKQRERPVKRGTIIEMTVHFALFVSFQIVIIVVAQGQWKRKKIIVQNAVTGVKPFSEKSKAVSEMEPRSERTPPE